MARRTRELLDRLQINLPDLDAQVALMSGGQRQAVAVARAVAFSSKLVILDEPTAALGLRESARVLDLVRRLKDDGVAVILISHSMDHVMAVADRALVLRRGRAVGETDADGRQPGPARGLDRRRCRRPSRVITDRVQRTNTYKEHSPMRSRKFLALGVGALGLVAASCGSGDDSGSATTAAAPATTAAAATTGVAAGSAIP